MEQELINIVLNLYNKHGIVTAVFAMILGFTTYEFSKYLAKLLWLKLSRTSLKKWVGISQRKLLNHVMFSKLETLSNFRVNNLAIICPLRNRLFSDMLKIRFYCIKNIFKEFLKGPNINAMSQAEFKEHIAERLQAIMVCWVSRCLNEGVPAIAITKFKECTDKTWAITTNLALEQCLSTTTGQTNVDRLDTVMDMIGSLEATVFPDVEKTLSQINGELSKIIYKGSKCQNCELTCALKQIKQ